MRPYMLWLARVYGGDQKGMRPSKFWRESALEDWISYQSEQRFLVKAGRR